jgi:hypothetical protein
MSPHVVLVFRAAETAGPRALQENIVVCPFATHTKGTCVLRSLLSLHQVHFPLHLLGSESMHEFNCFPSHSRVFFSLFGLAYMDLSDFSAGLPTI